MRIDLDSRLRKGDWHKVVEVVVSRDRLLAGGTVLRGHVTYVAELLGVGASP